MQQATAASPDGRQHGRRARAAVRHSPEPRTKDPDGGERGGARRHAARARARAARPARRQPAGRRGAPLARRRRCSPRAGTAAPARSHAEVDALSQLAPGRRSRRDGDRHPRALQPHRPHRPVLGGARSPRASPASIYAVADPNPNRPAAPSACGRPASTSRPACSRTRRTAAARLVADRAAARPPARHREMGAEPRRPGRGIRRHEPVDHRPRGARRRPSPPRGGRRHRRRHRHGAGR